MTSLSARALSGHSKMSVGVHLHAMSLGPSPSSRAEPLLPGISLTTKTRLVLGAVSHSSRLVPAVV
jgi:hypothetical protein